MSDPGRAAARRARLLEEIGTASGTDNWASSSNPIKKRIGRLEVAWREVIQWLLEDIRKMFANFETVSDAYDILDVNIAAVKSLCIEKGVFTEAEFAARQKAIFGAIDAERARRQAALARAQEEQQAAKAKAAEDAPDPELVEMRKRAAATKDEDHIPASATIFGG